MIKLTTSVKSKYTNKGVKYLYFINDTLVRSSFRVYTNACAIIDGDKLNGVVCCGNFDTCGKAYKVALHHLGIAKKLGHFQDREFEVVTFPKIEV